MPAYTTEEIAYLTEHFPNTKTQDISNAIGRSYSSVSQYARKIGLKKTAEYMASCKEENAKKFITGGYVSRFKKGNLAWNKGIIGLPLGGETKFQKGHRPHHWKPIGSERLDRDGFLIRKYFDTGVKKNDWIPVHVYVWRQQNGMVPDGCVIAFKDGDNRNVSIENLECITRAELLSRNSVHRFPKEITYACQLIGALNRQINKRTK